MALCRVTSGVGNVLLTLEKEVEGRWPERVQHGKVERCLLVKEAGCVGKEGPQRCGAEHTERSRELLGMRSQGWCWGSEKTSAEHRVG